jgi:hypothetical protein
MIADSIGQTCGLQKQFSTQVLFFLLGPKHDKGKSHQGHDYCLQSHNELIVLRILYEYECQIIWWKNNTNLNDMRRSFYVKAFDTTSIAILIILDFKKFKAKMSTKWMVWANLENEG